MIGGMFLQFFTPEAPQIGFSQILKTEEIIVISQKYKEEKSLRHIFKAGILGFKDIHQGD